MAEEKCIEDLEGGLHSLDDSSDDSLCYSDADDRSWHSPLNPFDPHASSYDDDHSYSDVSDLEMGVVDNLSQNSVSEYSDNDLDDEEEGHAVNDIVPEIKVTHSAKEERDCRICHLGLENGNQDAGVPIVLGCSCKDDLAAAHKQCAEAWFKIKGNKTCEICGSTACNIVGIDNAQFLEQWNEASTVYAASASVSASTATAATHAAPPEQRGFWRGHRLLNFLLACMIFAFVISWLFHFNVPS